MKYKKNNNSTSLICEADILWAMRSEQYTLADAIDNFRCVKDKIIIDIRLLLKQGIMVIIGKRLESIMRVNYQQSLYYF